MEDNSLLFLRNTQLDGIRDSPLIILLYSLAKNFTLTMSLSTREYKSVTPNLEEKQTNAFEGGGGGRRLYLRRCRSLTQKAIGTNNHTHNRLNVLITSWSPLRLFCVTSKELVTTKYKLQSCR